MSPLKDLTKAVHKQQKALEAHLEACLQELRKLCLREAVRDPHHWWNHMGFLEMTWLQLGLEKLGALLKITLPGHGRCKVGDGHF